MRKILLCLCLISLYVNIKAQNISSEEVTVSNLNVANSKGVLFVSMEINPYNLKLKSNEEVVLTPILMTKTDSKDLPSIIIAGRKRYFLNLRNFSDKSELNFLYRSKDKSTIKYQINIPYKKWMGDAELILQDSRCGCMRKIKNTDNKQLMTLEFAEKSFVPKFVYMPPIIVKQKNREICGSAYIDFLVNQTNILENHRNNRKELKKIFNSINSVKSDPDATITSLAIKGYASPDGKYDENIQLAKGRTESLMKYVQNLYSFPSNLIHTDYVAEDWEGLKKFIENSSITNKQKILEIINCELEPDPKEWRLKSRYKEEYKLLLTECYPSLRHSDYKISYTVKAYTDIEEAKRVMKIKPGNLSQHEFYQVANTYQEGSNEYNEVFDTMVRIYPDDEVANLNAANVAMSRGDFISAQKFLKKAGNSIYTSYARGVYKAVTGNYQEAKIYFREAQEGGILEATKALEQLKNLNNL